MRSPADQTKMVNEFNRKYKIGTAVDVTRDNGEVLRTKTASEAQMIGGHTAVIWVDGITGCYSLNRVKVV